MNDEFDAAEAVEWEQYETELVGAAFDLMTAFEEVFGASQGYDERTNRPIPEHTTVELFLLRDVVELANTTRLGMRWFGGGKLFLWPLQTAINAPLIPFAEHFATWRTATPAEIRGLATFIRHVAPHMDTAVDIWTELGRGQTVEAWHVLRETILSTLRNEKSAWILQLEPRNISEVEVEQ